MKNLDTTTGEIKTREKKHLTEKEKNREQQFERLLQASAQAREIRELMITTAPSMAAADFLDSKPLNYFLLNFVYAPENENIKEFKKFREWKEEGATIIKGSKAYPIWGQPVKMEHAKQDKPEDIQPQEPKGDGSEKDEGKGSERFPMCYVFSNLQVTKKGQEEAQPEESREAEALAEFPPIHEPEPIEIF